MQVSHAIVQLVIRCAALALAAWSGIGKAADLPAFPPGLSAPAKPLVMPAFELPMTDSNTLRSESLRGQVVIVRYWASW